MLIQITVFLDVTPCSLVSVHQMHVPEHRNLNSHRRKNLRTPKYKPRLIYKY
jgi:hypothetical protein